MITITHATQIFQKKQEINQLTADINKLRAELAYWERMRDFEAHQKFMASRKKPA